MPTKINWEDAIKPLLKKYKKKLHPLQYHNLYECLVMVVLSAQSSDDYINKIAPALFDEFPNLSAMAKASDEDIYPFVKGVVGHPKKIKYLFGNCQTIKA
jgi:endonuclease-3